MGIRFVEQSNGGVRATDSETGETALTLPMADGSTKLSGDNSLLVLLSQLKAMNEDVPTFMKRMAGEK
jgi:hypothetical protein